MSKEPYDLEEKLREIEREAHISAALSVAAIAILAIACIGALAAIIIGAVMTKI